MLTNTFKRLVYLARSTKRSIPQPILQENGLPQQKQTNKQYSHPISPTLKKIDKKYNEAMQKQRLMQKQMMESINQLKRDIIDQNQKNRIKQQKIKNAQIHLKNLQIPTDLRKRLEALQNSTKKQTINLNEESKQTQKMKKFQDNFYGDDINDPNLDNTNSIVSGKFIKSQQQAKQLKKLITQKEDPLAPEKLHQQIMLQQILKKSKSKQAKLNLPNEWQKQIQQQKKLKQQQNSILNQRARYQKLQNIVNQKTQGIKDHNVNNLTYSNQEIKRLDYINDSYKIQVSKDEVWRSKYSPELIQKAMDYKNNELKYFKELIQGDNRDLWDAKRERSQLKQTKERKQSRARDLKLYEEEDKQLKQFKGLETQTVQQQGLTRYQDLQYYRQKGIKQYQQSTNVSQYDRLLKQSGDQDLNQSQKLSDIFLDDVFDPESGKLQRAQKYQKSTFAKYETKLKQLSKKMSQMGISYDYQDLKMIKKQQLFSDKKLQEQNQSYKQYLLKKQKKKQMKEQLKKIHKQKLRQDLNFDYEVDPVKLQNLDPLEMQQGMKRMQEIKKMKQSTVVSQQYLKQKIHYTKTLKMMTNFVSAYFYKNFQNATNTINKKVEVGNIIANKKNTVLNVFWKFHPEYLKTLERHQFNQYDVLRQKRVLQKKLQKQSPYISSKMTEYLGLRYGPDIRFYFDQKTQQTKEAYREMKKYKDQIIELTIEQYKQKNVIKTPQQQKEYRQKISTLVNNNLQELNNQQLLINKSYQKKKKLQSKLSKRKDQKDKKNNTNNMNQNLAQQTKKYVTEKQKSQNQLKKIISDKVEKKKESIFTPYIQDQELIFGTEKQYLHNNKMGVANKTGQEVERKVRKVKASPVQRMWDEIEKGI